MPSLPLATPALVQSCTRAMERSTSQHRHVLLLHRRRKLNQIRINCCPRQEKYHTRNLSQTKYNKQSPDAVLRQPPASCCCFYMIHSIVLRFVIFLGNENNLDTDIQGSQCHLQTNTTRWQGVLLTQLNMLNYAHGLPEHMLELLRLSGALNPFFKPGSLQAVFKPPLPAVLSITRGSSCHPATIIFFHFQPTILMVPKLFCIYAKTPCAKSVAPEL